LPGLEARRDTGCRAGSFPGVRAGGQCSVRRSSGPAPARTLPRAPRPPTWQTRIAARSIGTTPSRRLPETMCRRTPPRRTCRRHHDPQGEIVGCHRQGRRPADCGAPRCRRRAALCGGPPPDGHPLLLAGVDHVDAGRGCPGGNLHHGEGQLLRCSVAPTVKITANPATAALTEQIDFNASALIAGIGAQAELMPALARPVLETASGALTWSEVCGETTESVSRLGARSDVAALSSPQLTPMPLATLLMASIRVCIADEMPAEDL
jgi:hypothetical protein